MANPIKIEVKDISYKCSTHRPRTEWSNLTQRPEATIIISNGDKILKLKIRGGRKGTSLGARAVARTAGSFPGYRTIAERTGAPLPLNEDDAGKCDRLIEIFKKFISQVTNWPKVVKVLGKPLPYRPPFGERGRGRKTETGVLVHKTKETVVNNQFVYFSIPLTEEKLEIHRVNPWTSNLKLLKVHIGLTPKLNNPVTKNSMCINYSRMPNVSESIQHTSPCDDHYFTQKSIDYPHHQNFNVRQNLHEFIEQKHTDADMMEMGLGKYIKQGESTLKGEKEKLFMKYFNLSEKKNRKDPEQINDTDFFVDRTSFDNYYKKRTEVEKKNLWKDRRRLQPKTDVISEPEKCEAYGTTACWHLFTNPLSIIKKLFINRLFSLRVVYNEGLLKFDTEGLYWIEVTSYFSGTTADEEIFITPEAVKKAKEIWQNIFGGGDAEGGYRRKRKPRRKSKRRRKSRKKVKYKNRVLRKSAKRSKRKKRRKSKKR